MAAASYCMGARPKASTPTGSVFLAAAAAGAPRSARPIHEGYGKLLACRWKTEAGEPAPFALEFARDRCGGMTQWQINAGKSWLVEHGYMQKAGVYKRATLWLPGDGRRP